MPRDLRTGQNAGRRYPWERQDGEGEWTHIPIEPGYLELPRNSPNSPIRDLIPFPPQHPPPPTYTPSEIFEMADRELQDVLRKLKSSNTTSSYQDSNALLSKAKIQLLKLKALVPAPSTPTPVLLAAREVFEMGALLSIRAKDPAAFTRYVHQLTPFYELPSERLSSNGSERRKITGLYLLLLLTQGDYAGFHTELEGLELMAGGDGELEEDRYLGYPIKLERWLMEGSYDRVWKAMASREVPSEEYSVFSEILTTQIRSEIASCSETAYPSLPISSTKNLLFLDSEGAVISFAQSRDWIVKDGRIYFPKDGASLEGEEGEDEGRSLSTIENTLGYARELETIV